MNKYFKYEYQHLWDESSWKDKISQIYPLVVWLGEHEHLDDTPYSHPVDGRYGTDCQSLSCYHRKTNSVAVPEVLDSWRKRGMFYDCRSQGGVGWLVMAPQECMADFNHKIPALVVMHQEDLSDPYWAMKTLDRFEHYHELAASERNLILIHIVSSHPDVDRIYVNILQEAFVFVPADVKSVGLDVQAVYGSGCRLADIPDFTYRDDKGFPFDNPDAQVRYVGAMSIPVLDISGRWENSCSLSRDQVSKENWSSIGFDLSRVVHSETGHKMSEGMSLEYDFASTLEDRFISYWRQRGLRYDNHEIHGHRWKAVTPLSAFDALDRPLPVICMMQEVNHTNEHLAVTAASYFYEYHRIAAQGECMLIAFVLEDPDSNELLCEVLEEAARLYPMMDRTRVYIAGHSHNGYYALEFTVRHPDLIAAVATFGDIPGLQDSALFRLDERKISYMRTLDIPLVNLTGCLEPKRHFPLSADGGPYRPQHADSLLKTFPDRAASWQRRLEAFNCPIKSRVEIAATKESPDKAVRVLGIPADKSETLWLDGFELYIADIRNNYGKYHLRIVGEENMPHNTTPAQQVISWSFMRRFARDSHSRKTIELY